MTFHCFTLHVQVDLIRQAGVIIGIKVDKGTTDLPASDGETMTHGLDGLAAKCAEYYKKGARFAKWYLLFRSLLLSLLPYSQSQN